MVPLRHAGFHRPWHPHRKIHVGFVDTGQLKLAVSGCPRNCAEATCKDIGVICVDPGFEIHFAGAAGLDIKGTEVLGLVKTEDEALGISWR